MEAAGLRKIKKLKCLLLQKLGQREREEADTHATGSNVLELTLGCIRSTPD